MSLHTISLVAMECNSCRMVYGITPQHQDNLRESHKTFYCPAGHKQWYPNKTECEKAHDRAEDLEQRLFRKKEEILSLRGGKNAYKGLYNKTKEKLDEISPNSVPT